VLNIHARVAFDKVMAPIGRVLARAGVSPDAITVVGTVGVVAVSLVFFPRGWWLAGALIVGALAVFDLLDGAVARARGAGTSFGAVLDSTCDRIADAAVFAGIGWYFVGHYQPWMLAAALLCLVLGSLTSYIRARAEAAGFNATVGIAERADRLIVALLGTGLAGAPIRAPYVQAVALWALAAASTITVVQRLAAVYRQSHESADRTPERP
jgi:CDP-diacylglycerol--glycerol-3-phosphate 3-phosphatidyltransferase